MNKKVKDILKFSILFALLIFFLYLAFKGIDFRELFIQLASTNYFLAIFSMLIGVVLGSIIRAERWRYFLYPEKKDLKLKDLFSAVMVGYFVNAIIPRGGEVSRPFVLAQKLKISKAFTFGTIIVERIFDMLSMFLVFGLCLFYYRDNMQKAFGSYDIERISLIVSAGIVAVVVVIAIMLLNFEKTEKFVEKYSMKFLPTKYHKKFEKIFLSLINSFLFIKYPKFYFRIIVLTALLWLDYAFSTYLTFKAFKDPAMNGLSFFDANLVLTMTAFGQTIPLPGNSAGAFHFFAKTTLVVILAVGSEPALAFATLNHLLSFIGVIVIGFYYSMKENYKFSMSKTEEQETG